jgi:hypothetical protein
VHALDNPDLGSDNVTLLKHYVIPNIQYISGTQYFTGVVSTAVAKRERDAQYKSSCHSHMLRPSPAIKK